MADSNADQLLIDQSIMSDQITFSVSAPTETRSVASASATAAAAAAAVENKQQYHRKGQPQQLVQ